MKYLITIKIFNFTDTTAPLPQERAYADPDSSKNKSIFRQNAGREDHATTGGGRIRKTSAGRPL